MPTPGFANAATRVQNPDGTLASQTDYQGNITQYTWKSPRRLPLSTTRATGTPLAQTTCGQWHAGLPLKTASATPGRITTWVYNGFPDPFNSGALATCAPTTALLPDASPIVVLCKQVDQATMDTSGALGFAAPLQASVPTRVSSWTYTPAGQLLRVTQPDGSFVQHSYDAAQRLVGLADHSGNTITYTLDNAGKHTAEQIKDPAGVLTRQVSRVYDALGWAAKTIGLE